LTGPFFILDIRNLACEKFEQSKILGHIELWFTSVIPACRPAGVFPAYRPGGQPIDQREFAYWQKSAYTDFLFHRLH
jgi:hypothetical protein